MIRNQRPGRTLAKNPDYLHQSYIAGKRNCGSVGAGAEVNLGGKTYGRPKTFGNYSPDHRPQSFKVNRLKDRRRSFRVYGLDGRPYGSFPAERRLTGTSGRKQIEQKAPDEKICYVEPAELKGTGKKRCRILFGCVLLVFLLVSAAGYFYYKLPEYCVKDAVTIEAGSVCPDTGEFLNWENEKAYISSEMPEDMVFDHVEDIQVAVHLYHRDILSVLHVADTTPPELKTRDKTIMLGDAFTVEDFVEQVSDATDCEIFLKEVPDIRKGGTYHIILGAKDEGGNITEERVRLEVIEDVTPPVIEGVAELTVVAGGTVSYKRNVTVTDDHDAEVKLEVDNSQVDIGTPGDYPVIYRAADKYGNTAEVSTVIHVIEERKAVEETGQEIVITEEIVNAEADKILQSITDPSMSQYEVIQAIYNFTNKKIAYVNGTPKSDWVTGAYYGLVKRRGDCFAFAMASKCLLNRAGITNMDIQRVRIGNSMHFWNLVDIGEGWHHFDTCRRGDGATFFYLTDAELMAYSDAHISNTYPLGTHYYDRTLYPVIP